MSESSIFILFSPMFKKFGCDIGREYANRVGAKKIHGICTGGYEVKKYVELELGNSAGNIYHLGSEESKWISDDLKNCDIEEIDRELGEGTLGRVIVSDRRIGRGFVRGGACRPDIIGDQCISGSTKVPERYVLWLYQFINRVFLETSPSVVFCYAVAGAPAVMMAEVCKNKKIPFSRMTALRIKSRYVIDDDPKGRLRPVSQLYYKAKKDRCIVQGEIDEAASLYDSFISKPEPPAYTIRNHTLLKSRTLALSLSEAAKKILAVTFSGKEKSEKIEKIKRECFKVSVDFARIFEKINIAKYSSKKPSTPYIYYPLHVDPEASTMVLSPYHTDQINVIESLAKSAPAGMSIVVKEHAPMVGLRPRGFYKAISEMPRVFLVPYESYDSINLIKSSSVVAVLTGTAALEGIQLEKPVVVMGDSPFLSIGEGMVHEPNLANLSSAIVKSLNIGKATKESVVLYFAAGINESFSLSPSLLWGKYEDHGLSERREAVNNIVDGVIRREKSFQYGD